MMVTMHTGWSFLILFHFILSTYFFFLSLVYQKKSFLKFVSILRLNEGNSALWKWSSEPSFIFCVLFRSSFSPGKVWVHSPPFTIWRIEKFTHMIFDEEKKNKIWNTIKCKEREDHWSVTKSKLPLGNLNACTYVAHPFWEEFFMLFRWKKKTKSKYEENWKCIKETQICGSLNTCPIFNFDINSRRVIAISWE